MRYEVRRGSTVLAHTEHEACIDHLDRMQALMHSGHSIYIDGKYLAKKDLAAVFNADGTFSAAKYKTLKEA